MSEIEFQVKYQMIRSQIDAVKEYLIENWDSPDSDEICDILGIAKTKTVELDVVIKGIVTVSVPINYDAEDLNHLSTTIDFNFDDYDVDTEEHDLEIKELGFLS